MGKYTKVGVFIIAIFTDTCYKVWSKPCSTDEARNRASAELYGCLNDWSVFGVHARQSAFLTDDWVADEICRPDAIRLMDTCVVTRVGSWCSDELTYWRAVKEKYKYICKTRSEFNRFTSCRKSQTVARQIDKCIHGNFERIAQEEDYCSSLGVLRTCLSSVLNKLCRHLASEYFMVVFGAEISVLEGYMCPTSLLDIVPIEDLKEAKDDVLHTYGSMTTASTTTTTGSPTRTPTESPTEPRSKLKGDNSSDTVSDNLVGKVKIQYIEQSDTSAGVSLNSAVNTVACLVFLLLLIRP